MRWLAFRGSKTLSVRLEYRTSITNSIFLNFIFHKVFRKVFLKAVYHISFEIPQKELQKNGLHGNYFLI